MGPRDPATGCWWELPQGRQAVRPSWAPGCPGSHPLGPPHTICRLGSQAPVALRPEGLSPCAPPSSASPAGRSLFWERVNIRKCTHTSPRPYHTESWIPCPPSSRRQSLGPRCPAQPLAPGPQCQQSAHCPPHSCPSTVQRRRGGGGGGAEGLQVTPIPPWLPRALRQEPGHSAGPTAHVPTPGLCLLLFLGGRPPSSGLGPWQACCLLSRTVEVLPG